MRCFRWENRNCANGGRVSYCFGLWGELELFGFTFVSSFKAWSGWNAIIERIERILAWWNKLYLLKGGRIMPMAFGPNGTSIPLV